MNYMLFGWRFNKKRAKIIITIKNIHLFTLIFYSFEHYSILSFYYIICKFFEFDNVKMKINRIHNLKKV